MRALWRERKGVAVADEDVVGGENVENGVIEFGGARSGRSLAIKKDCFTEKGKNRVWGARVCGSARGVGRGCGR